MPHQILSNDTIPVRLRKPLSILITFFEKFVSRCFTGIVAATPAISRRFPSSKTVIVQNFPIENELKPRIKISYLARPSKVLYIGGIENIRGATEMVQAIGLIPKSFGVQLVMAGNFSNIQFENDIRKMDGWTRVDYRGWVNRGNIATLLEESRMGLVVLHPRINYLDSYPVKLFEYMAAGIPVIASDFPLWREIVESAGCGLLVNPLKLNEIVDAVVYLLENPEEAEQMGKNGRQAVLEKYSWGVEEKKLLEFYKKVLQMALK